MITLTSVATYIFVGWALLFVLSLPVLAALIRSSQLSQSEEQASDLEPVATDDRLNTQTVTAQNIRRMSPRSR